MLAGYAIQGLWGSAARVRRHSGLSSVCNTEVASERLLVFWTLPVVVMYLAGSKRLLEALGFVVAFQWGL